MKVKNFFLFISLVAQFFLSSEILSMESGAKIKNKFVPKMRKFNVVKMLSEVSDLESINLLLENCQNPDSLKIFVKKLNLTPLASRVTDDFFEKIVKSFPNLEDLNLSVCSKLTKRGFSYLPELSKLRILDLSCCFKLKNDSLAYLSHLNNLQDLNLTGCYKLTGDGFFHLSRLCDLKKLVLIGIRFTEEDVSKNLLDLIANGLVIEKELPTVL